MNGAIAWFARNPVAANLLMVLLLVGGAAAALTNKLELFPEFSLDTVSVRVIYPGAAPEEIEESICIPIEEAIQGVDGIKKIRSTAAEGSGTVLVEVLRGADSRLVLDNVKTRVDAIDTFPDQAERPVIEDLLMRNQVIDVVVHGQADEHTLKHVGERVRDDLLAIPGISQVELVSARPYEVSIEVSEEDLRRHGLTFDDVARAVRTSSVDLSGGSLRTQGGEILLRTEGRAYRGHEFESIVLLTRPDGTRVLVEDVARVIDGFEDTDSQTRFDGAPAVIVQVFRVGDESALGVTGSVKDYVEGASQTLPEGLGLYLWQDRARMLEGRLDLMFRNGAQGLALVFLVLALFLRFRLAFWVTLGIPISFLGAMLVLPWIDVSINMMSIFAFILVLGVVVDDAIIVGESVAREREAGGNGVEAAIRGTKRVAIPVTFAVLTSVIAFTPMLGIPGLFGKFFGVIPMAVIPMLLFSLVESKWILPAHLSHESDRLTRLGTIPPFSWWTRIQGAVARGLQWCIQRTYRPVLERALAWRYVTFATAIAAMLLTMGLIGAGAVRFIFFPDIEGEIVTASVRMPLGTSADVTERAIARLESSAAILERELEEETGEDIVLGQIASVGNQPMAAEQARYDGQFSGFSAGHLGEVSLELSASEQRSISSAEISARWRELCGPIPGTTEVSFESALMRTGADLEMQFSGYDSDELRAAVDEFKGAVASYNGVVEVADSHERGKEELVLDILPSAEALGLTRLDMARQVRQAFYGEEAQRIQRGRDEVKVMVRYPTADRRSLHNVETMRIRTPDGAEVPFSSVARSEVRAADATISRTDRERTINVTADLETDVQNPTELQLELTSNVLPGLLQRYPSVRADFEGQTREQAETVGSMVRLFLFALLGIYAVMAIPFKSYVQPMIVMAVIPFGIIGAVLGHLVMGMPFSTLSVCGVAALAGIVVNDSLVLVDFVNKNREAGMSVVEAARIAGVDRFRPIILTSLTTFAGLTPILTEKSVQAQFLIPMAVSIAFGVLFSTLITLILVPTGYLVLEDLRRLGARLFGRAPEPAPETA